MVSPRTPLKQRYGPTGDGGGGGGGGRWANSEVRDDLLRERVGRRGLDLRVDDVGTSNSFSFRQNNGSSSDSEWSGVQELMSDDMLVSRAREAIERAERRGHGVVELEEREWEAWQRHEAIEEEIGRRVAETLEAEKRRKIAVPVSARLLGSLTSIRGSPPPMSSQIPSSRNYPDLTDDNSTLDTMTTTALPQPPLLGGALPGSPESESLSRPVRSIRHVAPASPPQNSIRPTKTYLPSSSGTSPLRSGRELSPQPGSSYYPGKHPNLSSMSDLDLSRPESSGGDEASVLSESARIRRQRREELRAELRRR